MIRDEAVNLYLLAFSQDNPEREKADSRSTQIRSLSPGMAVSCSGKHFLFGKYGDNLRVPDKQQIIKSITKKQKHEQKISVIMRI